MKNEEDYIVSETIGTKYVKTFVTFFKSEYRDENIKNKFYAHVACYDKYGNENESWNTDDHDTIKEVKQEIIEEYKNDDIEFKF